jgi:hypothetical protein
MPCPQAGCCRGFSQSSFASRCPSHPSGSYVPLEDALLKEQDEVDRVNLLVTTLQNTNNNTKTHGTD